MATSEQLQNIAESYLQTLVHQDADAVISLLGRGAIVEDPRLPGNKGEDSLRGFVAGFKAFFEPQSPRVEFLRTTVSPERILCESILHVNHGGETWELPVGVVVGNDRETGATRVHVYYTNWPFLKRHSLRAALYREPQPNNAEFSGSVLGHVRSLGSGDLEGIRDAWEADVYLREASGPPYTHWGRNQFVEYCKSLFSRGAPMLRPDTVNEGGPTVFMEFAVVGWDGTPWPEERWQSGLAVYQRTAADGLLCAVRIYDDVEF
jgi:hypothetical protein